MRSKAERIHNTKVKQKRKIDIVINHSHDTKVSPVKTNPVIAGKLRKGKVHCSCPMCATKTNVHGHKVSEVKKMKPTYVLE